MGKRPFKKNICEASKNSLRLLSASSFSRQYWQGIILFPSSGWRKAKGASPLPTFFFLGGGFSFWALVQCGVSNPFYPSFLLLLLHINLQQCKRYGERGDDNFLALSPSLPRGPKVRIVERKFLTSKEEEEEGKTKRRRKLETIGGEAESGRRIRQFSKFKARFPFEMIHVFLPILEKCMPLLQKVVLANPFPIRSGGGHCLGRRRRTRKRPKFFQRQKKGREEGCEVCFPFRWMTRRRRGRKVN